MSRRSHVYHLALALGFALAAFAWIFARSPGESRVAARESGPSLERDPSGRSPAAGPFRAPEAQRVGPEAQRVGPEAQRRAAEAQRRAVHERDRRALERASSAERVVAASEPVLAPTIVADAEAVLVRVVDASGSPVAGARVRGIGLLERIRDEDERALLAPSIGVLDPEAELAHLPFFESDAQGIARVPRSSLPARYGASTSDAWGETSVSSASGATITLAPDPPVLVRLVDSSGAPAAGFPVALSCASALRDDLCSALTDDEGRFEVRHWAAAAQRCLTPDDACVRAVLLARDPEIPCLRRADALARGGEQYLQLPPHGRVAVRVRTSDGATLHADDLELARSEDAGRPDRARGGREVFGPHADDDEHATFEHVGLGLELCASTWTSGFRPAHAVGSGPTRPGELATIELVVEEPVPVLRGRLVGGNGRPLARQTATLSTSATIRGARAPRWFTTDDDGRFHVAFPRRGGSQESGAPVSIDFRDALGVRHVATCDVPSELGLVTEVGDVRFTPLARIAIGSVVDEHGERLARARVVLDVQAAGGEDWTERARIDVVEGTGSEAGTFTARAERWSAEGGARWRIGASAPGYEACEREPFECGDIDVVVRLGGGGVLRGSIAEPARANGLRVLVAREGAGEEAPTECEVDANGAFRFAAARPGRFALRVIDASAATVAQVATLAQIATLARIDGIELAPGVESSDPRVQSIELAPRAR